MLNKPFSFEGRIHKLEYNLTLLIFFIGIVLSIFIIKYSIAKQVVLLLLMIPNYWFMFAQSTKRCHDLGKSGWWQLVPFYWLWLMFANGENGINKYGVNPNGF